MNDAPTFEPADDPAAEARVTTRIRSFARRGSRMPEHYERGLLRFGPAMVLEVPEGEAELVLPQDARVDLTAAFGRDAPLIVEIGPGDGRQLVHAAGLHPEWNFLGIEAWLPGVARAVTHAGSAGVTNVRLLEADAAQALPVLFGLEIATAADEVRGGGGVSADGKGQATGRVNPAHPNAHNRRAHEVWTFFPDPWRKARHRKRRLVDEVFAMTVAGMLEDGGRWRLATDWDDYAWQMRDVLEACPLFENPHRGERPDANDPQPARGGFAPRFAERIRTKFEERGHAAERAPHDFTAVRRGRSDEHGAHPSGPGLRFPASGDRHLAGSPDRPLPPAEAAASA